MSLLPYQGRLPRLADGVYVAPTATVIGDVELAEGASVWFGTVLRGDVMPIRIGARTNVQDLCVAHGTTGRFGVEIGAEVTVGHRVVLHGCTVADRVLVGMGAVLLDGCRIASEVIVAAGAVVPPGMEVPSGVLVAGVPAKVRRELTEAEREAIRASAARYVELAQAYQGA